MNAKITIIETQGKNRTEYVLADGAPPAGFVFDFVAWKELWGMLQDTVRFAMSTRPGLKRILVECGSDEGCVDPAEPIALDEEQLLSVLRNLRPLQHYSDAAIFRELLKRIRAQKRATVLAATTTAAEPSQIEGEA